jgi:putative transposase
MRLGYSSLELAKAPDSVLSTSSPIHKGSYVATAAWNLQRLPIFISLPTPLGAVYLAMQESNSRSHLKRLPRAFYEGSASYIHWTMTREKRQTGWLDSLSHARIREFLLHSLIRYELVCPIYILMPDHGHFLLMGYSETSCQKPAIAQFRRQWNQMLKPTFGLQHQAHDNVLTEKDRERDAFQSIAYYISQNSTRAGLVSQAEHYPYWGTVVPGYPQLDPRKDNFWNSFWLTYNDLAGEKGS